MLNRSVYPQVEAFFNVPTEANLESLIESMACESGNLEFKEAWISPATLAMHILAIGNSGGGLVLIGIREGIGGELEPIGVPEPKDSADFSRQLAKYIPADLKMELVNVPFTPPDGQTFETKPVVQVIFIEVDVRKLPYMARNSSSDDVLNDRIYVRRGSESVVARRDELEALLNQRLDAGYSSSRALGFSEHLEQLKIMYGELSPRKSIFTEIAFNMSAMDAVTKPNPLYPSEAYDEYIAHLIDKKKLAIERYVGVHE